MKHFVAFIVFLLCAVAAHAQASNTPTLYTLPTPIPFQQDYLFDNGTGVFSSVSQSIKYRQCSGPGCVQNFTETDSVTGKQVACGSSQQDQDDTACMQAAMNAAVAAPSLNNTFTCAPALRNSGYYNVASGSTLQGSAVGVSVQTITGNCKIRTLPGGAKTAAPVLDIGPVNTPNNYPKGDYNKVLIDNITIDGWGLSCYPLVVERNNVTLTRSALRNPGNFDGTTTGAGTGYGPISAGAAYTWNGNQCAVLYWKNGGAFYADGTNTYVETNDPNNIIYPTSQGHAAYPGYGLLAGANAHDGSIHTAVEQGAQFANFGDYGGIAWMDDSHGYGANIGGGSANDGYQQSMFTFWVPDTSARISTGYGDSPIIAYFGIWHATNNANKWINISDAHTFSTDASNNHPQHFALLQYGAQVSIHDNNDVGSQDCVGAYESDNATVVADAAIYPYLSAVTSIKNNHGVTCDSVAYGSLPDAFGPVWYNGIATDNGCVPVPYPTSPSTLTLILGPISIYPIVKSATGCYTFTGSGTAATVIKLPTLSAGQSIKMTWDTAQSATTFTDSAGVTTDLLNPPTLESAGSIVYVQYLSDGNYHFFVGGGGSTITPSSCTPAVCQGGSGSAVTSLTTTPKTVCSAGTARTLLTLSNSTGTTGSGVPVGYCSVTPGKTPSSTSYDYVLYPNQSNINTGSSISQSAAALSCVAVSTATISASACQTGTSP